MRLSFYQGDVVGEEAVLNICIDFGHETTGDARSARYVLKTNLLF